MIESKKHINDYYVVFPLVLGFVLRIYKLIYGGMSSRDSYFYTELIKQIYYCRSFEELSTNWPDYWIPIIPFIGPALIYKITADFYLSGIVYNIFSGELIIYLIYCIGKKTITSKYGLIAAIIAAIHPKLIELSVMIQRENTALVFTLVGYLIYLIPQQSFKSTMRNILSGLLIGIGFATRIEFLFCLLFFRDPSKDIKKTIKNMATVIIAAMVSSMLFWGVFGAKILKHYLSYFK